MPSKPRVQQPQGNTGNLLRDSALGLVPETLEPYAVLNKRIWYDGPLGAAELELARLYNARHVNCVFCRSVRYDIARADGLDELQVSQVDTGFADSELSERQKLILTFVDRYLNDPSALSDQEKAALRREFSGPEMAHLAMAVLLFNSFSRCAVALGGMPEELPLMEISVPD